MSDAGYHERLRREKRHAALTAAFDLFVEQGYGVTTLQQIAARAGISTSTLFKHFPTKAEAFEAMVLEVWSFDVNPVKRIKGRNIEVGLTALARDLAERISRPRTIAFYRVFIAAVPAFPELGRVMYERGKLAYVAQIESFLRSRLHGREVEDRMYTVLSTQLFGMITDRVFWPRVLVPDLAMPRHEEQGAVREAVATLLARIAALPRPTA